MGFRFRTAQRSRRAVSIRGTQRRCSAKKVFRSAHSAGWEIFNCYSGLCWELLTFSSISSRAGWQILTLPLAFQAEQKELAEGTLVEHWRLMTTQNEPLHQSLRSVMTKWWPVILDSYTRDFARSSAILSEYILYLPHLHVRLIFHRFVSCMLRF